ncbi:MAG: energy transducer TonB [Longimicrobiales bacterium]
MRGTEMVTGRPAWHRLLFFAVTVTVTMLFQACSPPEPLEQPLLMPDPSPFQYPVSLWDGNVTGETVLLVHVTREGKVDSVSVFNGSGHSDFDSAAVAGARKLRFVPGKRGARPVDMWTKLPVRFAFDSATVRS